MFNVDSLRQSTMRNQYIGRGKTLAALLLTAWLAACGGGGGDAADVTSGGTGSTGGTGGSGGGTGGTGGSGGGSGTTTASLSGTVAVNGLVRNAVVCLDLNANSLCDAGEPASAPTGASGAYTVSYNTSVVLPAQVATSSLIAPQVPGATTAATTTLDQADGIATADSTAYVLRQVPGKAGQINPLTTLVAAGVAAGMSEAVARANVVLQLALAEEARIDDYQADTALTDAAYADNARTASVVTAYTLEQGIPLSVGNPAVGFDAAPNDQRSLRFVDASNYSFSAFNLEARPAGSTSGSLVDLRDGRTGGVVTAPATLYNQAYLTTSGWKRCDATEPITFTLGLPNRSVFCGVLNSIGARGNASVSNRSMAEVVGEMQTAPGNTINVGQLTNNLVAALGMALFPPNSNLRVGFNLNLNRPFFINSINTDGVNQATATNLEQLISARPASNAALPGPVGSLNLGLGSGNFRNLRVAFSGTASTTEGTVQFYECDLDTTQTIASNCGTAGAGSYTISTANGVRVMRFTGNAPTVMNHERVYAEVKAATQANAVIGGGDWVFLARQNKPDIDSNAVDTRRLNGTAWQAMKTQLGI